MEDEMVTLKHAKKEWSVRAIVLRNCSVVLNGILRDADQSQPKILSVEDMSVDNVETFLSLATMISYDRDPDDLYGEVLEMDEISRLAPYAMPLVDKYDCKFLLKLLQAAQNLHPDVNGILAIIKHDESLDWMSNAVKGCLLRHTFVEKKRTQVEKQMDEYPQALIKCLFTYMLYDHNVVVGARTTCRPRLGIHLKVVMQCEPVKCRIPTHAKRTRIILTGLAYIRLV